MSIIKKLFTALRGGATEVGEAIVDTQALRILDQEIRDATEDLRVSEIELTKMMAQKKLTADKLAAKKAKFSEYEGYAEQAIAKGDESLAMEIASKMAEQETEINADQTTVDEYSRSITQLEKAIREGKATIARLKQQVDTVKATESVQRAQVTIAARTSGVNGSVRTALDSLERIKNKQAETAARLDAAKELESKGEDSDLQSRLRQAGIVSEQNSASAILQRLKQKNSNPV